MEQKNNKFFAIPLANENLEPPINSHMDSKVCW